MIEARVVRSFSIHIDEVVSAPVVEVDFKQFSQARGVYHGITMRSRGQVVGDEIDPLLDVFQFTQLGKWVTFDCKPSYFASDLACQH